MHTSSSRQPAGDERLRPEEYLNRLQTLQRREWWAWGMSVGVMLLLTAGVASLSLPTILSYRQSPNAGEGTGVIQAIAGLVFLILLFGGYLTYEKVLINRLRMELAERQIRSSEWRNLALIDPLTGLYNRRFAERRLRAETARAERHGYALTVVMLDLDLFKVVNDKFGHAAGDLVLKEFAVRLSQAVRDTDLAARLGGDEFLVLLTECDLSQLPRVLGRLTSIEITLNGERIPVEFSWGAKQYERGLHPGDLLMGAAKALYANKEARKAAPKPQVLQPTRYKGAPFLE